MTSKTLMRLAILLLLGLLAGAADDTPKVYVGAVHEISRSHLEIDRHDTRTSIGFVGDPAALAQLDDVKVGDEVRVVFGGAPNPSGHGQINKLLSIRRCAANDAQCDADGVVQDAKDAEVKRQIAITTRELEQCRHDMELTLLADPRYAPPRLVASKTDALYAELNALTGAQRECADAVLDAHSAAVHDACEVNYCGDQVGGGCAHIVGHSMTDGAIARAVATCKDKAP